MSLFNALNPGNPGLAAERLPLLPPLLLNIPEIGSLPFEDLAGHPIWLGCICIWSRIIPFEAIHFRQNKLGKSAHWILLGPYLVFHIQIY